MPGKTTETYNQSQIQQYFQRIQISPSRTSPSLNLLTTILHHQLITVPFESLALHYSVDRHISIDPQDLFQKIVLHRRGGYCLENNTFFAHILRSLGFHVTHIACRISNSSRGIHDGGWRGMSHMANIVTVQNSRYLVDVGFGGDGPCKLVPLTGEPVSGEIGQKIKCEQRTLTQHGDKSQKVWVYAQSRGTDEPWVDVYHFLDVEMFHADFEILNYYNMRMSAFAKTIVVQRFVEGSGGIGGHWTLVRDLLKMKYPSEVIVKMHTEQERLDLLRECFGIVLTSKQIAAIKGRPSELVVQDEETDD